MQQDVSAYYDQTQNHYQRWWRLDKGMSLHYGLWYENTRSFLEALGNTNQFMAELAGVSQNDLVLDAGCGVGGAAIYLAKNYGTRVWGVSLSKKQIETAEKNAQAHGVNELVTFKKVDYSSTDYPSASFDIIWACESSSSAPDKNVMLREWHRLLKPGGRLILLDFFKATDVTDSERLLDKWSALWAMSPLITTQEFHHLLVGNQFIIREQNDLSNLVEPTIRWMYRSYLLGRLPARLYNLLFGARYYSRNHYKSGLYQYQAFKNGLWVYHAILAVKSDPSHEKK